MKKIHNVNGPYRFDYDPRRSFVVITYENGSKVSKSYPRYLVEQKLGRQLSTNEEVHHIDGNPDNNDLSNLLVINGTLHRHNHCKYKFYSSTEKCVVCGKSFEYTERKKRNYYYNTGKFVNKNPTCCRQCQLKFARMEQLRRDS